MSAALLAIDGLVMRYGESRVLDAVSLTLDRGETLALTGESGSGKSTLLHLTAGLDRPEAGSIRIAGAAMTGADDAARAALRRDKIGLVFQQFNLIPSLSVAANIGFQARLKNDPDPALEAALAARLGLASLRDRWPEQLSGGQQQRVAIARALAARPALLLADEPTGSLDEATGDAALALMLDLAAEQGAGVILATHSARVAARCARRVHLRQGRLT